MKKILLIATAFITLNLSAKSQTCNPQGNQTSYGTNNVWIGYVYDNIDLTNYKGYVTEGTYSNPNFDENFGGSNVYYATNGCSVRTETFSVRYKLTKAFNGTYKFTVGGDDGYRLSLDGGATWVINKWFDQSYANTTYSTSLNGTYNLVLEYYENGGENRISFNVTTTTSCGVENTAVYGTNNSWNGYIYQGTDFNTYVGMVHAGNESDPSFNENFGGSNTQFATSGCNVETENFSARYRLTKTFPSGTYTFVVGGDDGYRLSLNGGNTWVINNWTYHSYTNSSITVQLNGTYNLVLEYFEGSGDNYLSFLYQVVSVLPVKLLSFDGKEQNGRMQLNWKLTTDSDPDYFDVEKSTDGTAFTKIATVGGQSGQNNGSTVSFTATDASVLNGQSWYRLKMVDMSGVVTYSKTITVTANKTGSNQIKVFPTIVTNNTININSSDPLNSASVSLTDFSGKTVFSREQGRIVAGGTIQIQLNAGQLPHGIYLVRISDNGKPVSTQKIIIQ